MQWSACLPAGIMVNKSKRQFCDHPGNVRRILYSLYVCCAALLLTDVLYHRHSQHAWDSWWGFYPLFGFVGCVLLVLIAGLMRRVVKRPQDYYANGDDQ